MNPTQYEKAFQLAAAALPTITVAGVANTYIPYTGSTWNGVEIPSASYYSKAVGVLPACPKYAPIVLTIPPLGAKSMSLVGDWLDHVGVPALLVVVPGASVAITHLTQAPPYPALDDALKGLLANL